MHQQVSTVLLLLPECIEEQHRGEKLLPLLERSERSPWDVRGWEKSHFETVRTFMVPFLKSEDVKGWKGLVKITESRFT